MKGAWVRIASSVRAWRFAHLFFNRYTGEVCTLEAMRTQAFSEEGSCKHDNSEKAFLSFFRLFRYFRVFRVLSFLRRTLNVILQAWV